ncbi:cold shock domain-containing protein [Priestia megaterium]|uniref:cold shock domain-containing protein n=1 Tax=Priestia megaterium TaxID=1404 RepID=UPI0024530A05|nr:cold shock domain-containing protein [Priestia megaterium]MDH3183672.1 cold shock domain-containing protein [Priestia megaterium]
MGKETGVIKVFFRVPKTGFITPDDGSEDLLFSHEHVPNYDEVCTKLYLGQRVSFERGVTYPSGPGAKNVTIL